MLGSNRIIQGLPTATPTPTPGTGQPPAGTQILIQGFAFHLNDITVPVGTQVVWINMDPTQHTTTSDTGVWSSSRLDQNQWFAITFNTPGVYTYHCAVHPTMTGVVRVVNNTPTPTITPTPTNTPIPPPAHIDSIGIFRTGTFYLRLHNSTGFADINVAFNPGTKPYPVVGDWNGSGVDTVGAVDQSNGLFSLCTANDTATCAASANVIQLVLGNVNDMPLAGRWTASATHAGVGVFRPSNGLIYLKNELTTGFADDTMVLGIPGDIGVAGDWNSDGVDSPGVYRSSVITYYLSNQVCNCAVFADDTFQYGVSGDAPVIGDWIAQGYDGVGLFRQTNGFTYLKNMLTTGFADITFVFGIAGDVPIAGHWQLTYPPAPNPRSVVVPPNSVPVPSAVPPGSGLGD